MFDLSLLGVCMYCVCVCVCIYALLPKFDLNLVGGLGPTKLKSNIT